jgi:hypothetical protein
MFRRKENLSSPGMAAIRGKINSGRTELQAGVEDLRARGACRGLALPETQEPEPVSGNGLLELRGLFHPYAGKVISRVLHGDFENIKPE